MKTVCVLGLGYIGLPFSCVLAEAGWQVIGVDIVPELVKSINEKQAPFKEPGLSELLFNVVTEGMLTAQTTPTYADYFIICVPSPLNSQLQPDISHIQAAAQSIAPYLRKGNTVILESTCPVGTTEQLSQWLSEFQNNLKYPHTHGNDADIHVAYCPERVIPGKSIYELKHNNRIIGALSEKSFINARELYQHFVKGYCLQTHARTAELCKLAENIFRDVNIALSNEFSMICQEFNIDYHELFQLANHHTRVNFLEAGIGVGGPCLAANAYFLIAQAPHSTKLIQSAREVNIAKEIFVLNRIKEQLHKLQLNNLICYGLTYKADIDDIRNSPAINIIKKLSELSSINIYIIEPNIKILPKKINHLNNVSLIQKPEFIENALKILFVNHKEFKQLSFTDEFSMSAL